MMNSSFQFDTDSRTLPTQLDMVTSFIFFAIGTIHTSVAVFCDTSSFAIITSCKTCRYIASRSHIFANALIAKVGAPFQQLFIIGHPLDQKISLVHQTSLPNTLTFAIVSEHFAFFLRRNVEAQVSACSKHYATHSIKLLSLAANDHIICSFLLISKAEKQMLWFLCLTYPMSTFAGIYHKTRIVVIQYIRQMYTDKIRESFEKIGFGGNTQINQQKFNDILSKLMSAKSGEAYDKDVADELWEQASGGNNYIEITQVCQTINDGIEILQLKLDQINNQIRDLERAKATASSVQLSKIQNDIDNLDQDRLEFQQDLRLVTLPFGINVLSRNSLRYGQSGASGSRVGPDSTVMQGQPDENVQLRYILYFSIAFGLIQIIIIYAKYDFLNLMVVTCLLSIYLLNHFDNLYIRLSFYLLAVSEVFDIIWLFMYASQKWNPPTVGNDSTYQVQYLRFIVFFTIVIICLKIPIGYYLFRIKRINDSKYVINMGMFKLILNANKSNPITRHLTNAIASNP